MPRFSELDNLPLAAFRGLTFVELPDAGFQKPPPERASESSLVSFIPGSPDKAHSVWLDDNLRLLADKYDLHGCDSSGSHPENAPKLIHVKNGLSLTGRKVGP
jgi:hypothetical protein